MLNERIKNVIQKVKHKPFYPQTGIFPECVSISVNSVCNLKCVMCDVGQRNRDSNFYKAMIKGEEIPLKELTEIARELKGKTWSR